MQNEVNLRAAAVAACICVLIITAAIPKFSTNAGSAAPTPAPTPLPSFPQFMANIAKQDVCEDMAAGDPAFPVVLPLQSFAQGGDSSADGGQPFCEGRVCMTQVQDIRLPHAPAEMVLMEWIKFWDQVQAAIKQMHRNCQDYNNIPCPQGCNTTIDGTTTNISLSRDLYNENPNCSGHLYVPVSASAECASCCEMRAGLRFAAQVQSQIDAFTANECSSPECTTTASVMPRTFQTEKRDCGLFTCSAKVSAELHLSCVGASGVDPGHWYLRIKVVCCHSCNDPNAPTPTPTVTPTASATVVPDR